MNRDSMEVERQHDRYLDPDRDRAEVVVHTCAYCDNEIFWGESHKVTGDDKHVHDDCWDDFAIKELGATDSID